MYIRSIKHYSIGTNHTSGTRRVFGMWIYSMSERSILTKLCLVRFQAKRIVSKGSNIKNPTKRIDLTTNKLLSAWFYLNLVSCVSKRYWDLCHSFSLGTESICTGGSSVESYDRYIAAGLGIILENALVRILSQDPVMERKTEPWLHR